ncbi:hypothetical protein ACHWQZ_G003037 [Mnemiopsis leidyi]
MAQDLAPQLPPTMERVSDIIQHDRIKNKTLLTVNEEEIPNRNHAGPNTPDECEQTMIHMGTETAKKPPKQDADHTWLHSLIENSIIDLKTEMEKLTDEMTQLKLIVGETSQPNNINNEARASNLEKQARKLNDLWEKNLSATSRIQNLINQVFTDINIAELRTSEVDNHLQRLKMDLKNYYNSAFFKEDSKLIKEIHAALCKAPARGTTANAQYPVVTEPSLGNFPVHPSRMPQLTPVTELQSRRGPGFTVTHSQSQGRTSNNMQDHTHVLTQGAEPHNTATASAAPQGQDERQPNTTFKTVLITDSILRHVQGSANVLGVNHELKVINKRDTSGLKEKKVLETLEEYKPDFVYVHLVLWLR